ncbi:MAG: hypothetical protein NTW21_40545 [Verrucomicrobia bacterium]|nr:hypothetical protein [Verrucomicrobiota bacterium]
MQKLQILFPAGSVRKLREIAKREDRPMSEIVRTATEAWLNSQPSGPTWSGPVPTFDLGLEVSDPELLKELIYVREDETR